MQPNRHMLPQAPSLAPPLPLMKGQVDRSPATLDPLPLTTLLKPGQLPATGTRQAKLPALACIGCMHAVNPALWRCARVCLLGVLLAEAGACM